MNDDLAFLIGDVSRLIRRRFDERARTIGVTRPQWRVLVKLARREGQTQGALAEQLEVEPITLCRMVDRLVEAGLVERRRDPGDRRAWNIYLTPTARPIIDRLRTLAADMIDDTVAGIDPAMLDGLSDTLARLRDNLQGLAKEMASHG